MVLYELKHEESGESTPPFQKHTGNSLSKLDRPNKSKVSTLVFSTTWRTNVKTMSGQSGSVAYVSRRSQTSMKG